MHVCAFVISTNFKSNVKLHVQLNEIKLKYAPLPVSHQNYKAVKLNYQVWLSIYTFDCCSIALIILEKSSRKLFSDFTS